MRVKRTSACAVCGLVLCIHLETVDTIEEAHCISREVLPIEHSHTHQEHTAWVRTQLGDVGVTGTSSGPEYVPVLSWDVANWAPRARREEWSACYVTQPQFVASKHVLQAPP